MFCQKAAPVRVGADTSGPNTIAFLHALHGENIGLDCSHCHTGATSGAKAYLPAKADCMDCHRLPLTENPGIEKLDSALAAAPAYPWKHESALPEHVVFHHGVHAAAGVQCADCHRSAGTAVPANAGRGPAKNNSMADVYGGDNFTMQSCLACHRGETASSKNFKRAATYCAACHR
ncbi:cytochrome c3 family protein [Fibrobacter succinogenes]|uniref:cytochrome c3 family protein n=1 Tax=Fibrobacter succinogenes TaxID=833 RepID=UPI001563F1BA|nr:cytochrome c3 family protein [Fibrobacter succinogenes]